MNFIYLFSLSSSKIEERKSEITFSNTNVEYRPISARLSLDSLAQYIIDNNYMTKEAADSLLQKLKISKKVSTRGNTFILDNQPSGVSVRRATKQDTRITIVKDETGQFGNLELESLVASADVKSETSISNSIDLLLWKWKRNVKVEWKPLDSAEISRVQNFLDDLTNSPFAGQHA